MLGRTFSCFLGVLAGLVGSLPVLGQPLSWTNPRQTALAGLAAPMGDAWAALVSPAAIGDLEVAEANLSAGRLYGLAGLPTLSAAVAGPVWDRQRAGLGVVRLGSGALTQTFAAGSYAYVLDKTSLAVQVGYYQLALGDGPTTEVPTFTLAGQTKLIPRLTLAGQVQNLTQPLLRTQTGERLPASFRTGAVYEAGPDLWLMGQIDKTLNRPVGLAAGVEYRVHRYLRLRAGAAPLPGYIGAGVRLDVWGMVLEYGLAHNGVLGQIHSLGLGWAFVSKSKPAGQTPTD